MANILLKPHHARLIRESAISDEVAEARGYRSVLTKSELRSLGFSQRQARVPALLIPIRDVRGEVALYQARPDEPRIDNGKPIKYETPAGARMVLDVPPMIRAKLADPKIPLHFTEGVRKADAAVSAGLVCVGLLGVWNWRGTNEHGGKVVLTDLESIALNKRPVYITFDSDVMTKSQVYAALVRFSALLASRQAQVHFIYLPPGEAGAKVGLDDYLAAGNGIDDLLRLARLELISPPEEEGPRSPYEATPEGLLWWKTTQNGVIPVRLSNFIARITAEVNVDDGAEVTKRLELEGSVRGRTCRFALPAARFLGMGWPVEHLGAEATMAAGFGLKDHARAAIQTLSDDIARHRVYAHLGWHEIDGHWVYLHAGGGIGAEGHLSDVEVELPAELGLYLLPSPPEGQELVECVRACLVLFDVAPRRVTVPLIAAIWRSVITPADFSLHLAGPTGVGKSELAAIAQQHFGPGMDSRHLPASWSSTGNALEGLAFQAAYTLLVVDDFAPTGTTYDVQRLHREGDRLLRAQGNRSGRQRMRADASLRPTKPPRGLILSTGEDVPRGQSLRARVCVIEIGPHDLSWSRLTPCQVDAAAGRYAGAMSGFLRWLAPQHPERCARLRTRVQELREQAVHSARHKRTPEILAHLMAGIEVFLEFARGIRAIDTQQAKNLWKTCWAALGETGRIQGEHQASAEPVRRFLEFLAGAIATGRAHLATHEGNCPGQGWGWREVRINKEGDTDMRPQGDRAGWIEGEDVYLEAEAAYTAAQRFARDSGDSIPISSRTLARRLNEGGLLASTEERGGQRRFHVRRTCEGRRRDVLHFKMSALLPEAAQEAQGPRAPGQPARERPALAESGATDGATPEPGVAQLNDPELEVFPKETADRPSSGPLGPLNSTGGTNRSREGARRSDQARLDLDLDPPREFD